MDTYNAAAPIVKSNLTSYWRKDTNIAGNCATWEKKK